jgi:Fe-S-cluster containining protein
MIEIDNCMISRDLVEKKFVCNLERCKGACCIQGDSGAPLADDELKILKKLYPKIKHYLRQISIDTIEQKGTHVIDYDHENVTPLVNDRECAYVIYEGDIAKCVFEKANNEGIIDFKKPISCHLYPIRIQKLKYYDAINYDIWDVCNPAREFGEETNTPVYKFLETSIIRKFGKKWYNELKLIAREMERLKSINENE